MRLDTDPELETLVLIELRAREILNLIEEYKQEILSQLSGEGDE